MARQLPGKEKKKLSRSEKEKLIADSLKTQEIARKYVYPGVAALLCVVVITLGVLFTRKISQ